MTAKLSNFDTVFDATGEMWMPCNQIFKIILPETIFLLIYGARI